MSKFLTYTILFLLLIGSIHSFGQDNKNLHPEEPEKQDTIDVDAKPEKQMPFRKGRVLMGANVYISSDAVRFDTTASNRKRYSNNYNLEFKAGYFVIDKFLVGALFRTNRTSNEEFVKQETETLQIGPYFRYYLSPNSHGGVFIHMEVNYSRFRDEVNLSIGNTSVDRLVKGSGIGGGLGVGYSYSPFDRMSLDMSVSYILLYGKSTITDWILKSSFQENFLYNQILFGLGVNIIL